MGERENSLFVDSDHDSQIRRNLMFGQVWTWGLESIGPFANICEAHMRISVTYASLNDPFSKVSSSRIPNLWSHGLEDRYMNMVESILYPAIKEPVLICNYS